jgi:hypothetical protein
VAEVDAPLQVGLAFVNFSRAASIAAPLRPAFTSMKDSGAAVLAEDYCNGQVPAGRSWECIPWSA